MKLLFSLLIVAAIAYAAFSYLRRRRALHMIASSPGPWACKPKAVLSKIEQFVFFRIQEAMPECIVLSQVDLSRVVSPVDPGNYRDAMALHNRIRGKSLDFLVCLKDFSVIAAVELDDSSREKERRVTADETKNAALASAGIPLLRWDVREIPTIEQIRAAFTR